MRLSFLLLGAGALLWACSGENTTFPNGTGTTVGSGGAAASGGNGSGGNGTAGDGSGAVSVGGSGQGGVGGSKTPCTWASDANTCGDGFYCDAEACGDGLCEPLPANDDAVKEVVCGCDDVQYWNANTSAAHGTPVKNAGRCEGNTAVKCGGVGGSTCRQGLYCGRIGESIAACAVIAGGTCWGMPDDCPIGADADFRACVSSGGTPMCVDECTAITRDGVFWADGTCT